MALWWLATFLLFDWALSSDFYTAAVYEHSLFAPGTNSTPTEIIQRNLALYKKAASVAKSKGADIIVFPEYGLLTTSNRLKMKDFLEDIPDPKKTYANPCKEKDTYSQKPILVALSCMARSNYMFVVANMGDIQKCNILDDECPQDGDFHFNTNVVFDRDGILMLKYYKEHLFFEEGMDLVKIKQDPTFRTDFGRFATFISFDISFRRMGDVGQSVDGIAFSAMWGDIVPQFTSVPFFQGWAIGNNVTLMAANIHLPGYHPFGSGIFTGRSGALAYSFNPDGLSKLVVARILKQRCTTPFCEERSTVPFESSVTAITLDDSWSLKEHDDRDVKMECSKQLLDVAEDIHTDYRCLEENLVNYTFVKLTEKSGHVEACHNGMCCSLDYSANKMTEGFFLGVWNGTYNSYDRYGWCEENCVLARCEPLGDRPCATFPRRTKTSFQLVQIRSNFTTKFVYPTVVTSGMRLLPRNEWKYSNKNTISFKNMTGRNLMVVGLKGRCYDRDPPYVR